MSENLKKQIKIRSNMFIFVLSIILIIGSVLSVSGCSKTGSNDVGSTDDEALSGSEEFSGEARLMYDGLIFNTPVITGTMEISPVPHDFWIDLTDFQLTNIFPEYSIRLEGTSYFSDDGTFAEIFVRSHDYNFKLPNVQIQAGIGVIRNIFNDNIYETGFVPQVSYINNIPITVLFYEWNTEPHLRADFEINGIVYHIRIRSDDEESGKELMVETINMCISNGTDWVKMFDTPEIPELRSEAMTITEAYEDEAFGAFVPRNIPAGFVNEHGVYRSVRGHLDENMMYIEWQSSFDFDDLREAYNNWVNNRESETEVYTFEDIFWGQPSIRWMITDVYDYDLERLVSLENPEHYDWSLYPLMTLSDNAWAWPNRDVPWELYTLVHDPLFTSNDLTPQIIQARTDTRPIPIQGADGSVSDDQTEVFFTIERTFIRFGVLFDNAIINIQAEGVTPNQILSMLRSTGLID